MKTNILTLAITLTVGIILAGSLLMPVLSDATTTEKTFTNSGAFFMTDADDTYTLTYDPSGKFIVNGEDIAFTELPSGERVTIISTEEFLLRFAVGSNVNYALAFIDATHWGDICKDTQAYSTTLTFNNGTLTISANGTDTTYTYTSDSFRGIAKNGGYVMTLANTPTKVNSDTTIIVGNGLTQVTTWHDRFYIEGTVENMTVTAPTGITISDITVNSTPIEGYIDLVEFTSIQFKATDGENDTDATYNRVIVPAEVTAELSQHLAPGEIAILNALPILIITALVVMAAGALYLKRDD